MPNLDGSIPQGPWKCFHCNEVFDTVREAQIHFGLTENDRPGCIEKVNPGGERGLLESLRRTEKELTETLHALQNEDSKVMRQMYAMQCRHSEALRRAEEAGYQRGLEDRNHA